MCIEKNVDNVDNFVENYYLQPEIREKKGGKSDKNGIVGGERRIGGNILMLTDYPQKNPHAFCG